VDHNKSTRSEKKNGEGRWKMEVGWKEGNCVEGRRKPGGLKRKWEGTRKHGGKKVTLNCAFRWTHTNFSTFHAIQILIVIVKKLM
jgi:hypothetical protein